MKQFGVGIDNEMIIMNQRPVFNMYHIWLSHLCRISACLIFSLLWCSCNPLMVFIIIHGFRLFLDIFVWITLLSHLLTEIQEFTSHHLQIVDHSNQTNRSVEKRSTR
jgi:hypothetical protein